MRIGGRSISKKLLFLLLVPAVLVLVGGGSAFAALMFTDIEGHTHEDSIMEMADRGITQGYPDGTFRPDEPVTRGQMMTFLDRYTSGNGCTDCHDESSTITGVEFAWSETRKGEGEAASYAGARADCSGCHSGGGFTARVAEGNTNPDVGNAYANPSRIDCRACHEIHETYTGADWALATTDAVPMYAFDAVTYDGGEGNLCANCHQPRRSFASQVEDGMVNVSSTHWGPHHGPQATVLLGEGGAGADGSASVHYQLLGDTCVSCHMGDSASHSFAPSTDTCETCHPDAEDFDIGDTQTEVQALLDELEEALVGAGLLDEEGEPIVGIYPEELAGALWNWIYLGVEDKSLGVHNPAYTKALLEDSLEVF